MAKSVFNVGERFECLAIIAELPRIPSSRRYLVRCDCGNEKTVRGSQLRPGHTISCGCRRNLKHGESRGEGLAAEWTSWRGMKSRCRDASHIAFKHYGGRGIKVCARWIDSYENFLSDMGRKPSALHSLDRIDVDGNYEPSNCRWASQTEQRANRRVK